MRTSGLLGLCLLMLGTAREARAQGGYNPSGDIFNAVLVPALLIEAATLGGGVITGAGSTYALTEGERSVGWAATSYALAALNFVMSGLWTWAAAEFLGSTGGDTGAAIFSALAIAHLSVGLWNVIVPTMGLAQAPPSQEPGLRVAPTVLTGRAAGGGRWSGLGIRVAGF